MLPHLTNISVWNLSSWSPGTWKRSNDTAAAGFLHAGGASWWANVFSPWVMLPFIEVPHFHLLPSDGSNNYKLPSKEKIFAWMEMSCLFWNTGRVSQFCVWGCFWFFFFFPVKSSPLCCLSDLKAGLTLNKRVKRAHQHILLQSVCLDGTARSLLSDCKLGWEIIQLEP